MGTSEGSLKKGREREKKALGGCLNGKSRSVSKGHVEVLHGNQRGQSEKGKKGHEGSLKKGRKGLEGSLIKGEKGIRAV